MPFPASLTELFEKNAPYEGFVALFERSPDFTHSQDDSGETPLHLAARHNRADVLALLLAQGVDKDSSKINGATPLYIAAEKGHIQVVDALLGAQANKDKARNDGATPFFLAAQEGHIKVVNALLRAHADKDKAMDSGATPLYIAAEKGHIQVVDALLGAQANKDKAAEDGVTPLFIAAQEGHIQVVDALLRAHADKDKAAEDGDTPLYISAQEGHIQVVDALLGAQADKDKANLDSVTPLYIAALNGHIEIVHTLLQAGANKDQARHDGMTPLFIAALNGHIEIVHTLLQAGANKDKARHDGMTPLFIAAQNGHDIIVNKLLGAGANIHLRCKSENLTPLHTAALKDNKECFELLLEHPEVTTAMLADIIIDMDVSDAFRMQATTELEKRLEFASEETKRAWPICPITQTFIIEPVMGTDGCCYEKSSITKWVNEHKTSPHSRQPMTVNNLIKPHYLADWIEGTFKQLDDAFFASRTTPMDLSSDAPMSREDLANHRARFFDRKRKAENQEASTQSLDQNKKSRE